MADDTLHDISEAQMGEYLERAMRRGVQIRQRRRSTLAVAAVAVICLVVLPFSVLGRGGPSTGGQVGSTGFGLVSWRHVGYPGLNVANARYPVTMGCGPGFPALFPVAVQQVTYVHPSGPAADLALVLVHCASGTPTPSSFYVFAPGHVATRPRLVQVLLAPPNPKVGVLWYANHFQVRGSTVTLPAKGVSQSAAVCCPDVHTTMRWKIEGSRLVRQRTGT